MHPDLEVIVSADEEARSRVTLAEQRRERALADACAARDSAIEARRSEVSAVFGAEVDAIRAEGEARVAELRRQQAQYLSSLTVAGEQKFEEAVALYLRIVCGAAP